MSHTRVKTTYAVEAPYAATETVELYCDHNHTSDYVSFYHKDGDYVTMVFNEWETNNDLWDAMNRLYYPYKNNDWSKGILKDNVEYYLNIGD